MRENVTPMKATAFPEEVLQLRIQIRDIEPPIYRVIQVTNDWTFHLLHEALQVAFGWENYHLYKFTVGATTVIEPDPEFPEPTPPRDPARTRLGDLISADVTHVVYEYDFGDA
jgi:Plasmid pRiA4b ORF-3-like protein